MVSLIPADRFRLQQEIELGFRTAHALAGMSADRYVTGIDKLNGLLMQVANLTASGP